MRKTILFLSVFGLLAATAQGAPIVKKKVHFGVKAGLSLSNPKGDTLDDIDAGAFMAGLSVAQNSKMGFAAGAFVAVNVSSMLAIQPEVLYVQKGVKFGMTIPGMDVPFVGPTDVNVDGKYGVDYFEIPVLLKLLIPSKGQVKPAVYAGPVVSMKASTGLDASYSAAGLSGSVPVTTLAEIKTGLDDSLQGTDFSVAVGASVDISHIVLDLRYTLGMSNIVKNVEGSDVNTKNAVLSAFTGVVF
jgi:hypothetical protein